MLFTNFEYNQPSPNNHKNEVISKAEEEEEEHTVEEKTSIKSRTLTSLTSSKTIFTIPSATAAVHFQESNFLVPPRCHSESISLSSLSSMVKIMNTGKNSTYTQMNFKK